VLGRPFRSNLGDSAAALASYRKSLAIHLRIAQARSDDRQAQLELWSSYRVLGDMLREAAGTREALETEAKAYELSRGLQRQWPDDAAVLKAAGQTEVMRQRTFLQFGAIEEMRRSVEAALEINQRLLAKQPASHELREEIASLHGRMAIALLKLGDAQAALPHAQQRVATAAAELSEGDDWVQARRRLSSGLLQLAQVLARIGEPIGAEDAQHQALELRRAIAAKDPSDRQSMIDVMVAHLDIGDLLLRKHDFRAAVGPLREAVAVGERLSAADPHHVYIRLSLASALVRLSSALLLTAPSQPDEPSRLIERAASIAATASEADPADVRFRFELAQAHAVKGDLAREQSGSAASADSANSWYARSLAILTELRDSGRLAGGTLNGDEPGRLAEIENKVHARDLRVIASK
jgi:tetratricopeptide (TPR) repeat protein